jgi:ATP-dependent exoDNAse (exonuclease V) beta subunit
MGYLPVGYGQNLADTLFNDFYAEERARSYLDNLNLLYVALTRAEYGLIVTAPHSSVKDFNKKVAGLLCNSIQQNELLAQSWNATEDVFKIGSWSVTHSVSANKEKKAEPLQGYVSSPWRNKLVIKQSSVGYMHAHAEAEDKAKYGIHIHAILSRIKYQDEWQEAFESLYREGVISTDEKLEIEKLITQLFSNDTIAGWFTRTWQVRTEVPVLSPGAGDNRIDRVMICDKQAVVVDFKTGIPAKGDVRQVLDYMNTLIRMNFTPVQGYLLYIKTGEVVPVVNQSSKAKGNKNQLGLEL